MSESIRVHVLKGKMPENGWAELVEFLRKEEMEGIEVHEEAVYFRDVAHVSWDEAGAQEYADELLGDKWAGVTVEVVWIDHTPWDSVEVSRDYCIYCGNTEGLVYHEGTGERMCEDCEACADDCKKGD